MPNSNVRYRLKTPYRDGTTHVVFEPPDLIARSAALVSKPRVTLTQFHGCFTAEWQCHMLAFFDNLNVRFDATGTPT
jgi:hypothetical protein